MVRHQTVGPDFQGVFSAVANEGVAVEFAVVVIEEDVKTIIPALGYVVRVVDGYCAGNTWHGGMVSFDSLFVNNSRRLRRRGKIGKCPYFPQVIAAVIG